MIRILLDKILRKDNLASIPDAEEWQVRIARQVRPYTMTSPERILATIMSVEYVTRHHIPGAIVECGVWKGGHMMAAALALKHLSAVRPIFLFDTFEGMTAPKAIDTDLTGTPALLEYERSRESEPSGWCMAGIDEVRANMAATGYPMEQVHLVKGPVEVTLPTRAPGEIALLRLDTDWYESTLHELTHLYPRVPVGGVVAIDDYGHWQGARRAVDEFLALHHIQCHLHRVDYTAREFIKQ